jgi:purine-binding chemotaxis protein CheW
MNASQQFSTFLVGGLLFGVDVMRVQEVIRYQTMTPVPLAPATVHGLINLRGQIVIAIDLRTRLGMPARDASQKPMNVVVRTDDGGVSLLVDGIGDVIEVDPETWERPPETLTGAARDLIPGAYKLKDRLLLVLDADRAVEPAAVA